MSILNTAHKINNITLRAFSLFFNFHRGDSILPQILVRRDVLSKIRLSLVLHFNPLSPDDALKHHFTSLKTYLIFLQPGVLE